MNVNELIKQNNEKRENLNEENKKYYTDLMLYIRTKLTLSEKQAEEVLMEMLDHLLEAQEEGKTASQVFGENPQAFADELIEQLPEEERRDMVKFVGQLAFSLLGWFLVARGLVLLLFSNFVDASTTVYIIPTLIIFGLLVCIVFLSVKVIFGLIHQSLFKEKSTDKMNLIKVGLFGAGSFAVLLGANYFIRGFGPSFEFSWSASIGAGTVFLLISWLMKFKTKINYAK
jgi:uncharacterized membrane-anchored protein